ncbi:MAG: hypothetical protein ACYC59_12055 [Anaerolineaceae bacterium]
MNGLSGFESADQYSQALKNFREKYVKNWDVWLARPLSELNRDGRRNIFINTLKAWGICRCPEGGGIKHDFSLDSFSRLEKISAQLLNYDLRSFTKTDDVVVQLRDLWIGLNGICEKKQVNMLIASKAIMLLTDGAIGPAFDSSVMRTIWGIKYSSYDRSFGNWINLLSEVSKDIQDFEVRIVVRMEDAAPKVFVNVKVGRLYDMAFGPRQ